MKKLGQLLSYCVLLMVALSFFSIVNHFIFNSIFTPIQELIIYLHSTIFMLGIVYAFHHDKHVRIDIFYQNYSQKKQRLINLLGLLFLFIPFFSFMIFSSFDYVMASWSKFEGSAESGGLPFVYGLKSLLLILPSSMLVYAMFDLRRKD
jgi:TRAP-type mannitol/chloroaromatic compound transport system permease small subunit